MKYRHIFFDLDHTLWDFDANSRQTLEDLYLSFDLQTRGVHSFDSFFAFEDSDDYRRTGDVTDQSFKEGLADVLGIVGLGQFVRDLH